MRIEEIILVSLLVVVLFLAVWKKKLTVWGTIVGVCIAVFVFLGAGMIGVAMLSTFFILGTLATSWGKRIKNHLAVGDNHGGQRTAGQVIANGGVAGLTGYLAFTHPECEEIFLIMMAASLSSALADTLSSELGTLYGKRFYNILTFRKDVRGENGVVSLEGSLIGIVGSCIIAGIFVFGYNLDVFRIIVISGTVGNISDSILGATLERKGIVKNNAVNLLNTIVAALTAYLLFTY